MILKRLHVIIIRDTVTFFKSSIEGVWLMKESRLCLFAARVTHVYAAFFFLKNSGRKGESQPRPTIFASPSPLCDQAVCHSVARQPFMRLFFFKGRERVTIDFTAIDRGDKIIVSSTPNSINPRDKIYYSYRLVFCSIYVL